jgi:hypothetical protein
MKEDKTGAAMGRCANPKTHVFGFFALWGGGQGTGRPADELEAIVFGSGLRYANKS